MSYYRKSNITVRSMEILEGRMLLAGYEDGVEVNDEEMCGLYPQEYPLKNYMGSLEHSEDLDDLAEVCDAKDDPAYGRDGGSCKATDEFADYVLRFGKYIGGLSLASVAYMGWRLMHLKLLMENKREVTVVQDGVPTIVQAYLFSDYAKGAFFSYVASRVFQEVNYARDGGVYGDFSAWDVATNEIYGLVKTVTTDFIGNKATSRYSELTKLTPITDRTDPNYLGYLKLSGWVMTYYAISEAMKCGYRKVRKTLEGEDTGGLGDFSKSVAVFSIFYTLAKFCDGRALMHAAVMNGQFVMRDVLLGVTYTKYFAAAFVFNKLLSAYKETFRASGQRSMMDVLWKLDTGDSLHDGIVNTLQYGVEIGLAFEGGFLLKQGGYQAVFANPERGHSLYYISIGLWNGLRIFGGSWLMVLGIDASKTWARGYFHSLIYSAEHAVSKVNFKLYGSTHDEL